MDNSFSLLSLSDTDTPPLSCDVGIRKMSTTVNLRCPEVLYQSALKLPSLLSRSEMVPPVESSVPTYIFFGAQNRAISMDFFVLAVTILI